MAQRITLILDCAATPFWIWLVGDKVQAGGLFNSETRSEAALGDLESHLAHFGAHPSQADCLAVGVGPGSFTGLRVALAFVQGLAFGREREIKAFSSFLPLHAVCQHTDPNQPSWAIIPASGNTVFAQAKGENGSRMEWENWVNLNPKVAVIPGNKKFSNWPANCTCLDFTQAFSSEHIAAKVMALPNCGVEDLHPIYLQLSAAEEKRGNPGG